MTPLDCIKARYPMPEEFARLHNRAMRGDSGAMDTQNNLIVSREYRAGYPAYMISDRATGCYFRLSKAEFESRNACHWYIGAALCALANGQKFYGKLPH